MHKRFAIAAFVVLFLATAAAMAFMFTRERPQWTTDSREALHEFEEGLSDEMKLYTADALQHYARALEIDPSFTMARMKVVQLSEGRPGPGRWLSFLESIDSERLSNRERALVEIRRARAEGRHPDAERIMNDYVESNPRDPHVLSLQCGLVWARQRWDEARSCYQRLLDVDPNWVVAVNHLGYISMAQGRFDEAADHFRTYRYIAPDQANPYDSMGELMMLRGRYEEARSNFTRALDIRPDFCASWGHLVQLDVFQGQTERARHTAERAAREPRCAQSLPRLQCQIEVSGARGKGVLDAFREHCLPDDFTPDAIIMAHRAALVSASQDGVEELTAIVRQMKEASSHAAANALLEHMAAMELLRRRQPAQAAERFAAVDGKLVWFGNTQGVFKIYNRAALVTALQRSGNTSEAARLSDETRLVNPSLFDEFVRDVAQVR